MLAEGRLSTSGYIFHKARHGIFKIMRGCVSAHARMPNLGVKKHHAKHTK